MSISKLLIFLSLVVVFLWSKDIVIASSNPNNSVTNGESQNHSEEVLEGTIKRISGQRRFTSPDGLRTETHQQLEITISNGSKKGQSINIESEDISTIGGISYQVGDRVVINHVTRPDGEDIYLITDYVRRLPLITLFLLFIALTIAVSGLKGVGSLFAMIISFIVIIKFILPHLYSGSDPVLTAIIGSIIIIPPTFFLSHGFNKKTVLAIIGTVITLILTSIISNYFIEATKLTGFASEEAGFLNVFRDGQINIRGLLLAGIIIGTLGVLDDVTVSQSSIIQELHLTNPKLTSSELYQKAMSVGRDHISSTVNTLVLVYTGAALPLLLLFVDGARPFSELINYEIVAEEVVRTLVGSIGLILAVPITTYISAYSIPNSQSKNIFRLIDKG